MNISTLEEIKLQLVTILVILEINDTKKWKINFQ